MRVLVIGGTGFISSYVARQLAEAGHTVAVFHRGVTHADLPPDIHHIKGDRRELARHRAEIAWFAPDVVADMIAESERDAQTLMDAFRDDARRVVVASSGEVYRAFGRLHGTEPGPPDPVPLDEDSPLRESFSADYDKIPVERIVMNDARLPGTILRLKAVYGPGDPQHRLFSYLKRMDDNRPAILLQENVASWRWSRGYVENVAAAIATAVSDERSAGRIYNVAEPDALTEAEWVKAIAGGTGWRGDIVTLPSERMPEGRRNSLATDQQWTVDTTRIRTELGYAEGVPRDEALRRTIEWERAHPPEEIDPARFDYEAEDKVLCELKSIP